MLTRGPRGVWNEVCHEPLLEVCTGPGLARDSYPVRPAGRAWAADKRWLFLQAGPANDRWFFQRAGPGRQKRNESGAGRARTYKIGPCRPLIHIHTPKRAHAYITVKIANFSSCKQLLKIFCTQAHTKKFQYIMVNRWKFLK